MRALKQFKYVEPNFIRRASAVPNDPAYRFQTWHYEQINMPEAWDRSTGTGNVKVAVLDTGVMLNHPDLATRTTSDGYDFIVSQTNSGDGDGADSDPSDPGDGQDNARCTNSRDYISSFHGTHVAGTIGASGNDNIGVAGVNWNVDIMPIRVLGCSGGNDYEVSQGILYAAGLANDFGVLPNSPADIINLSLGSDYPSRTSREAIDAARNAGTIIIAAAGNTALNGNPISYPASYPGVVSVGATNPEGQRAAYSQYNDAVDIAAPGGYSDSNAQFSSAGLVVSAFATTEEGSISPSIMGMSGTSMAAPHVAGVASLMKGIYPDFTADDFDLALANGLLTQDLGAVGRDVEYGYGLIDAKKSLQAAESLVFGVSEDLPPRLNLTAYEVDFGVTGTEAIIQAFNAGGGSLKISQVVSSANNISVVSLADSDGLGNYRVTLDRDGLAEGVYQGYVQFISDAGTRTLAVNYEELTLISNDPDAGRIYTLLYNVNKGIVERQDSSVASSGQYSFAIDEVDPAVYILVTGSDTDNDGYICGPGEACGYWPNVQEPDYLIANQSYTDLTMGIRYQTQIQVDVDALLSSNSEAKKFSAKAACQNNVKVSKSSNIGLSLCAQEMLRRSTSKLRH
ncbi:MAG: S8 family serine peptidase [Porticoccaceae bacterium]|nr:S8 family serine peptidase [Porticoccaceae bacterium]